jgi:hypothetical protein
MSLMTGSKQFLGERFQLNTFEDFSGGKAVTVKTGLYRWSATRYALVSGNVSDATQKRLCVAQDSNTCTTIATRDALDTFVRASVGKTIPYIIVAVISGVEAP